MYQRSNSWPVAARAELERVGKALANRDAVIQDLREDKAALVETIQAQDATIETLREALATALENKTPMRGQPQCGTYSGYAAHRRRGEEACAPCKEACRVYTRNRRSKK